MYFYVHCALFGIIVSLCYTTEIVAVHRDIQFVVCFVLVWTVQTLSDEGETPFSDYANVILSTECICTSNKFIILSNSS